MGGNPLWELVVVGVAAALVADTGWYLAGRRFGVSHPAHAVPRVAVAGFAACARPRSIFERFGPTSMLFAKFVPGFASVATAMAGAVRLRYCAVRGRSTPSAPRCGSAWASALGYLFRDAIDDVMNTLKALGQYGLMLVVAGFIAWVADQVVAAPACSSDSCAWTACPSTSCAS